MKIRDNIAAAWHTPLVLSLAVAIGHAGEPDRGDDTARARRLQMLHDSPQTARLGQILDLQQEAQQTIPQAASGDAKQAAPAQPGRSEPGGGATKSDSATFQKVLNGKQKLNAPEEGDGPQANMNPGVVGRAAPQAAAPDADTPAGQDITPEVLAGVAGRGLKAVGEAANLSPPEGRAARIEAAAKLIEAGRSDLEFAGQLPPVRPSLVVSQARTREQRLRSSVRGADRALRGRRPAPPEGRP